MQQERFLLIPAEGDIDEDEGLTKAEILGMLGRELLSNGGTTKKASELLEESAAPFDAACVMVRDMEKELEQLRHAMDELINEPQPLGIDRPAYQQAINAILSGDFLRAKDAEFSVFIASMPHKHWSKYDLSAVRLGWEAHKMVAHNNRHNAKVSERSAAGAKSARLPG